MLSPHPFLPLSFPPLPSSPSPPIKKARGSEGALLEDVLSGVWGEAPTDVEF